METCDINLIYHSDGDESDFWRTRKGNSKTGRKEKYMRTKRRGDMFYMDIINSFNTHMSTKLTGFTSTAFENLLRHCPHFIKWPMNRRIVFRDDEHALRKSRKPALLPDTILIMC